MRVVAKLGENWQVPLKTLLERYALYVASLVSGRSAIGRHFALFG